MLNKKALVTKGQFTNNLFPMQTVLVYFMNANFRKKTLEQ